MTKDEIRNLLNEVEKKFEKEGNLVQLESGQVIFVGDTHGDFQATQNIVDNYLTPENKIVFLGDYVDRGPASAENLNTLLSLKVEHPDNLFLLMGNHEGRCVMQFHPADFWERLDQELYQRYATVLSKLPLAASTSNGIIALHGALPNVETLEDINKIEVGGQHWHQITWGDWQEGEGRYLGNDAFTSRPQFGQDWFSEIMKRFEKNVLIRSHQPNTRQAIYDGRCLTIFTSSAYRTYAPERTIAIVDLEKEVKTVNDLLIKTI